MSLTIKAFLYERTWRGDPAEIRRFTIDQDVSSSYAYLLEKVVQIFPSLVRADNVTLAWTDRDGDLITISSDEELVEALDQFEGDIFRLYLKKKGSQPASNPHLNTPSENPQEDSKGENPPSGESTQQDSFHPGVLCDGCNGQIYGTRFKCLVCRDYDLCSNCEGKGLHVDHNMVSITDPISYSPWGFHGWGRGGFGPYRGRRGCCRGGRFGGHPPFPHGGCGSGRFHGGFVPWFGGFGGPGGCHSGQGRQCKPAASEQQQQEPMDTADQKPDPSNVEERRSFLQGVGEAVSNFLEPFGVKVDVDVIGGEKSEGDKTSTTTTTTSDSTGQPETDEKIEEALAQLRTMGYEDEGGWLRELVQAKGGDVAKVLDALHPSVEQV